MPRFATSTFLIAVVVVLSCCSISVFASNDDADRTLEEVLADAAAPAPKHNTNNNDDNNNNNNNNPLSSSFFSNMIGRTAPSRRDVLNYITTISKATEAIIDIVAADWITDPVKEAAAIMRETFITGTAALEQVRTTLPKNERERIRAYEKSRRENNKNSRRGRMMGKRSSSSSSIFSSPKSRKSLFEAAEEELMMNAMLSGNGAGADDSDGANNDQQQQQQRVAFFASSSEKQQQHVTTGDRRHSLGTDKMHAIRIRSDQSRRRRLAAAQAFPSDLKSSHESFAAFCGGGGLAAVPFTPDMNFTCYFDEVTKSTINGSVYAAAPADGGLTTAQRRLCYPEDVSATKICICPSSDATLKWTLDGSYSCYERHVSCALNITDPATFSGAQQAELASALDRGVPLRVPYVATIDRQQESVDVSATLTCKLAPASQVADISWISTNWAGVEFVSNPEGTLTSSPSDVHVVVSHLDVKNPNVVGNYSALRDNAFNYVKNLTYLESSSSSNSSSSVGTYPFVLPDTNTLLTSGIVSTQPYSFLEWSLEGGYREVKIADMKSAASTTFRGALVGGKKLPFSFSASNLTDAFFAGGQLSVEVAFEYRYMGQPASPSAAKLITFDVTNPPPPLPSNPPEGLSVGIIIIIVIGVVAGVSGIVAIVVAVYRNKQQKERRRLRKEQREQQLQQQGQGQRDSEHNF